MRKKRVRIAAAPIAWTNDDLPDLGGENTFEQCISEMALAGYKGSEIGNKYPRDPRILSRHLRLRGLSICNAWFSAFLTMKPFAEVERAFIEACEFLHAMGAGIIGVCEQGHSIQGRQDVPVFEGKPSFDAREWKLLADGLTRLGERAQGLGMVLTYHHHMGTGVQSAGEIETLMHMTDPSLVFLLYDTGHLVFSGEQHLEVLETQISRIRHVHLKDIRQNVLRQVKLGKMSFLDAVRKGVFTVPGDGDIDFMPVFSRLKKAGYQGWYVVEAEQDPALANPFEYALKARRYIRQKARL